MTAPRIAYLLKKFPRLSETFVLGEILAQEALGTQVHVFSRRGPDDEPRHAELARLRAAVEVLPSTSEIDPWRELFAAPDVLERVRDVHAEFAGLGHARLPSLLAEALWLLRRTRELDIQHVHVHFATDSAVVAMLLRALGGPPFSVTAHAKDIYRNTIKPAQLERILSWSQFVVTVCDANVAYLRGGLGELVDRKVRRLYNGIDIASFDGNGAARVPGRVLSIGRLIEKKGFDVLVDALALLRVRGVPFQATFVGDGEDRELVAQRVAERGLSDAVEMTGAVAQTRVRELLATSEVFCLPCRIGEDGNRDALPTVLLEAQAAGLPSISTPVAGVAEILDHGRAGLLVPENDVAATADALQRLLASAELRAQLAAAGARRVRELFDARRQSRVLRGWFDESVASVEAPCASRT